MEPLLSGASFYTAVSHDSMEYFGSHSAIWNDQKMSVLKYIVKTAVICECKLMTTALF